MQPRSALQNMRLRALSESERTVCSAWSKTEKQPPCAAQGRTSLLLGKQLPVPLGDDVDDAVNHL